MTALKWILIVMFALDVISAISWDAETFERTARYRVLSGVVSVTLIAWILAVL